MTDSAGNVTQRYDYLPFGEEIPADGTVRTTAMGYQSSADGFNPKFTGQVRDVESGLDYFNARYYSPEQGRFVSADPQNAGSDPSNPQTWNGYAYVAGNPMAYTDPSGQGWLSDLVGAVFFAAAVLTEDWAVTPLPSLIIDGVANAVSPFLATRGLEAAASSGNAWDLAAVALNGSGGSGDFVGGTGGGPWSESPVDFFGQQAGSSTAATSGNSGSPAVIPIFKVQSHHIRVWL